MSGLNECPECGGAFYENDNFCDGCGYDLRPHQVTMPCCETIFIPRADRVNRFCPFCGAFIGDDMPRRDNGRGIRSWLSTICPLKSFARGRVTIVISLPYKPTPKYKSVGRLYKHKMNPERI